MMIRFGSSQSPNRLPGTDGNPSPISKKLRGQATTTMAQLQMTAPDSEQTQELREIADRFERNTPANGRGGDHTYHVIEQVPDSHPLMRAALLRQRLAQKQAEKQKQEAFRKAEELAAKNLPTEELTKEMEKLGFTLLSDSSNPFAMGGPAQADSPAEDKAEQKDPAEPSATPKQKTPAQIEAAKRRRKAQAARRKEKAAAEAAEKKQAAPSTQEG